MITLRVNTGSPSSKYEHRRASALLRNIQNIRICMGKKPIVSVTYENERISIKNSLPYLKCVLRLSCVVHGPTYGRFMVFCVRGTWTQPVICVGCSVHYWVSCAISKGGFFEIAFARRRRHTFASLWGVCLRFASLWRANSRGDSCVLGVHLSDVCWGLLFYLRKSFIF